MGKSTYDPDVAEAICARIGNGETLRAICREEGNPSYVTFYNWMKERPELAERFADARARGFDVIAAECLEIADDATNDWMDRRNMDGDVVGQQLDAEHVQRSKLRIETRLKLLAKWDPKRYGDKMTLAGDPDAPLSQAVDPNVLAAMAKMTPEQLRALATKQIKGE